MEIYPLFDEDTFTYTYILWRQGRGEAIVIDPVLDYDPASSTIQTTQLKRLMSVLTEKGLTVTTILETHAHADHLTAASVLKSKYFPDAKIGIGSQITKVQTHFAGVFGIEGEMSCDGSQFDLLLGDGEVVEAAGLRFTSWHTPGHTPACVCYKFDHAAFTGDLLFMPDGGTGRCDFPGGDAKALYKAVTGTVYSWPEDTLLFTGHDYGPGGRDYACESSVGAQMAKNIHISRGTEEAAFTKMRRSRDATLKAPRLLLPSLFFNINAGAIPAPDAKGRRFVTLPLGLPDELA